MPHHFRLDTKEEEKKSYFARVLYSCLPESPAPPPATQRPGQGHRRPRLPPPCRLLLLSRPPPRTSPLERHCENGRPASPARRRRPRTRHPPLVGLSDR